MYSVALSVASCLRAGTEADVAWIVESEGLPEFDPTDAVALTPGGGRMGAVASGLLDSHLQAVARSDVGRLLDIELTATDALISGLPAPGRATIAVVPATSFPERLWGLLLERESVAIVAERDGQRLTSITVHTPDDPVDPEVAQLLSDRRTVNRVVDERLVTVLAPVTRLVIGGAGPIAEALEAAARPLGWQVARSTDTETAIGLMVGLSPIDAAVVMGHDVESSSRALGAALEGRAGYVGALGSARMQQNRADWLAYRGVTDLSRVHGPAGLDIGAQSPPEIALSVLAEAVAVLNGAA